ncbi:hypothetical protein GCM10020331_036740 [Ectobacillus funiculus]
MFYYGAAPQVFGAQAFYGLWASELFPTKYRARAQGIMFFIARIGVGLWTAVMPTVISKLGFAVAGGIMIAFLIVAAFYRHCLCSSHTRQDIAAN